MRVIEAMRDWMSSNQLRLKADKTQFIRLGTSHFLDFLQINSVPANKVVNNLGVYFNPELYSWSARWTALPSLLCTSICDVWERTARRSLTKKSRWRSFTPSSQAESIIVTVSSTGQSGLNSAARLVNNIARDEWLSKFISVSAAIRNELH